MDSLVIGEGQSLQKVVEDTLRAQSQRLRACKLPIDPVGATFAVMRESALRGHGVAHALTWYTVLSVNLDVQGTRRVLAGPLRTAALFCLSCFALACGSSTPPAQIPQQASVPGAQAALNAAKAALPKLDLAPAPKHVFAVGRAVDPQALLDTSSEWMNLPIPWRKELRKESPALEAILHENAPVDFLAALDPDEAAESEIPLWAASAGVKDYDAAVEALTAEGARVERASTHAHHVVHPKFGGPCLLSRALGVASARLVCGQTDRGVELLSPYMTTTLLTQKLSELDVFLEVRAEPLRERYGKHAPMLKVGVPVLLREVSLGNAQFDSALADISYAVADEVLAWVEDLDTLHLVANANESTGMVDVATRVKFRSAKSWVSRSLTKSAAVMGPAPDSFWRFPLSVGSASFGHRAPADSEDRAIIAAITDLAAGAADHFQLDPPSFKKWLASFGALSYAGEQIGANWSSLFSGEQAPALNQQFGLLQSSVGILDDASGTWVDFFKRSVEMLNDGRLRQSIEKLTESEVNLFALPRIKSKPLAVPGISGARLYHFKMTAEQMKRVTKDPTLELPKGDFQFALTAFRDQGKSWVAFAPTEPILLRRLSKVRAPVEGQMLAQRADLAPLRKLRGLTGAFLTLKSLVASMPKELEIDAESLLRTLPHKGNSPVFYSTEASLNGPELLLSFGVPKAAVEEIVAGVVSVAASN